MMMKSILRWSLTLGLMGSTLVNTGLGSFSALALPEEQIMEKLEPIPVFAIADDQGVPLVAVDNNQKITGVFISRQDAENFLANLQKQNPEIAQKVKVQAISLAQVYKLQTSQKEPNELIFDYVPKESEVEAAKKLLSDNGQQYKGGVPLYTARAGQDQGYLTINQNNQQVIPFFFEKATITAMVEQFKKQEPSLASTVKIEVIPLESVMLTLKNSNDEMLKKIVIVPSQETINYIRSSLSQQQNQQKQPNQQAPKP